MIQIAKELSFLTLMFQLYVYNTVHIIQYFLSSEHSHFGIYYLKICVWNQRLLLLPKLKYSAV